jgi:predicted Zn-dependent protease
VPEKVTYRFLVLRDPMVNAVALPNGSIYITRVLLALLENEAQLAGILGHEAAHIYEGPPILKTEASARRPSLQRLLRLPPFWSPADMAPGWPRLPRAT